MLQHFLFSCRINIFELIAGNGFYRGWGGERSGERGGGAPPVRIYQFNLFSFLNRTVEL